MLGSACCTTQQAAIGCRTDDGAGSCSMRVFFAANSGDMSLLVTVRATRMSGSAPAMRREWQWVANAVLVHCSRQPSAVLPS
jgi:hypothetical protein